MMVEPEEAAHRNGQARPVLRAELQLLHCMLVHGSRSEVVQSSMLTGLNRIVFDAIHDIEASGATVSSATVSRMLQIAGRVDVDEVNSILEQVISELPIPELFSIYEREIIERTERSRLEAVFSDGLSLCRSRASLGELQEHLASAMQIRERKSDPIQFVSGNQLAQMDTRVTFAVEDMIVAGQPLLLVGPKKSLKTNISVDLTISLATGLPFLGKYRIPRPMRAGLMSAESGAATIKETAHRVAMAKGLNGVQDAEDALFAFSTPLVSTARECERFRQIIEVNRLEFLNVDPSYLTFAIGDDGKNLFRMGELLAPLSQIGQETGCTICLSHHARKGTGKDGQPLNLGDESYSGFSEWARQWIFLSRREAYDESQPGSHRLWLRLGGSAGHSGLIGVDIEEGSRSDAWGRRWEVCVLDAGEIAQQRQTDADESRQVKSDETFQRHLDAVRDALAKCPEGATLTDLSAATRISKDRCRTAVHELVKNGVAEECQITKNKRQFSGWKWSSG